MQHNKPHGPDDPMVAKYMEYCAKSYGLAQKTLLIKRYCIRRWLAWLAKTNKTYMTATTEDVLNLKAYMEAKNYSFRHIHTSLTYPKEFHDWLVDTKVLIENVWPKKLRLVDRFEHSIRVPMAHQIFTMRRKRSMRLRDICFFELLLSSGVRRQVLGQIRTSDVTFDHNVRDAYTGRRVDCIGGSILVDPRRMTLKNKKPYVAYFSVAAARWLKLWYTENNLWKHPNCPVFAMSGVRVWDAMVKIGEGIPIVMREKGDIRAGLEREPFNKDVNTDDMDIPETLKRLIQTTKDRENDAENRGINEHLRHVQRNTFNSSESALPRSNFMRPHDLRHFFAGMMFWKCYDGARRDFVRVGKLLGHRKLQSLEVYLDKIECVTNDQDWERLMYGQMQDWLGFMVRMGGGRGGSRKKGEQPPYSPPVPQLPPRSTGKKKK